MSTSMHLSGWQDCKSCSFHICCTCRGKYCGRYPLAKIVVVVSTFTVFFSLVDRILHSHELRSFVWWCHWICTCAVANTWASLTNCYIYTVNKYQRKVANPLRFPRAMTFHQSKLPGTSLPPEYMVVLSAFRSTELPTISISSPDFKENTHPFNTTCNRTCTTDLCIIEIGTFHSTGASIKKRSILT